MSKFPAHLQLKEPGRGHKTDYQLCAPPENRTSLFSQLELREAGTFQRILNIRFEDHPQERPLGAVGMNKKDQRVISRARPEPRL